MRVFLAGATGVLGRRLVPLLVAARHQVTGMTRSAGKAEGLARLGAEPIVGDVYDAAGLTAAAAARPELVMQQLSDLPDERTSIPEFGAANARIRREGTRNLLAAARNAGAARFLVQSVAWRPPGDSGAAVEELERSVLAAGGVVLRYGQSCGPGTHYEQAPPPPPRVQIDEAARRTLAALDAPSGVLTVVGD